MTITSGGLFALPTDALVVSREDDRSAPFDGLFRPGTQRAGGSESPPCLNITRMR